MGLLHQLISKSICFPFFPPDEREQEILPDADSNIRGPIQTVFFLCFFLIFVGVMSPPAPEFR